MRDVKSKLLAILLGAIMLVTSAPISVQAFAGLPIHQFSWEEIEVINSIVTENGWDVPVATATCERLPREWTGFIEFRRMAGGVQRVVGLNLQGPDAIGRTVSAPLTGRMDISALSELRELNVRHNQLTILVLGDMPHLRHVEIQHNFLTSLDITGLPLILLG
jgi:Leucine-rich repeat (LRR) protein